MWSREPLPGDPVEDWGNQKIGIVVSFNHAADLLVIADSEDNHWEAPLAETAPYAIVEDW